MVGFRHHDPNVALPKVAGAFHLAPPAQYLVNAWVLVHAELMLTAGALDD